MLQFYSYRASRSRKAAMHCMAVACGPCISQLRHMSAGAASWERGSCLCPVLKRMWPSPRSSCRSRAAHDFEQHALRPFTGVSQEGAEGRGARENCGQLVPEGNGGHHQKNTTNTDAGKCSRCVYGWNTYSHQPEVSRISRLEGLQRIGVRGVPDLHRVLVALCPANACLACIGRAGAPCPNRSDLRRPAFSPLCLEVCLRLSYRFRDRPRSNRHKSPDRCRRSAGSHRRWSND
jgi:hypothetical protein